MRNNRLNQLETKYNGDGLTQEEFTEYNTLKGLCPACGDTGMVNSTPEFPFPTWIPCPFCIERKKEKQD